MQTAAFRSFTYFSMLDVKVRLEQMSKENPEEGHQKTKTPSNDQVEGENDRHGESRMETERPNGVRMIRMMAE
jgi:hypothetical protein